MLYFYLQIYYKYIPTNHPGFLLRLLVRHIQTNNGMSKVIRMDKRVNDMRLRAIGVHPSRERIVELEERTS